MKITSLRMFGMLLGLLLICSRTAADSTPPQFPAEVTINKEAGRNGWLTVPVRMEDGKEMPFIFDTGTPVTVFAKSMEPKLGKRLATWSVRMPGDKQESGVYAAPRLYLGSTPLLTGTNVTTIDFTRLLCLSHEKIMGILGMDCLRHYCIQLDFDAGKMRFLDPDHLPVAELGKAFPLVFSSEGQSRPELIRTFIRHASLIGGTSTNSLVDTGNNIDGAVESGELRKNYLTRFMHLLLWFRPLHLSQGVWDGDSYSKLTVSVGRRANALGLRFLARHLVTFDFPHQTMYLKRQITGPRSIAKIGAAADR